MDFFVFFTIIITALVIIMLLVPPTPQQLCYTIACTLAEAGNNEKIRKEKIDKLSIELKGYLFDDEYCKQYRESFGVLFDALSKNKDLTEAVFGNYFAACHRQAEIEKLPPPDTGGCG